MWHYLFASLVLKLDFSISLLLVSRRITETLYILLTSCAIFSFPKHVMWIKCSVHLVVRFLLPWFYLTVFNLWYLKYLNGVSNMVLDIFCLAVNLTLGRGDMGLVVLDAKIHNNVQSEMSSYNNFCSRKPVETQ